MLASMGGLTHWHVYANWRHETPNTTAVETTAVGAAESGLVARQQLNRSSKKKQREESKESWKIGCIASTLIIPGWGWKPSQRSGRTHRSGITQTRAEFRSPPQWRNLTCYSCNCWHSLRPSHFWIASLPCVLSSLDALWLRMHRWTRWWLRLWP